LICPYFSMSISNFTDHCTVVLALMEKLFTS
jgi:hypothetical protein